MSSLNLRCIFKGISGFKISHFNSPLRSALGGSRTLFTAEANGIDAYEKQRLRTQTQFSGMVDKFRGKMLDFSQSETKNMIFTEDLKNMAHLIEDTPSDLDLIHKMMKRFNQQNRHLRFGNFVFGPVLMRMYYFLNQPQRALDAFKDPDLEGFFEQLTSFQILCDLLYNNKMYQQVIEVFEIVQAKQVQGQKFPKNVIILVSAAAYKMNTVESYEYVLKMLSRLKETGLEPVRRVSSYAAALALNQNAPQVALEILTNTRTPNYVTIRNLKMAALAEINRPDDCLPILRFSLEFDGPGPDNFKKHTVCREVHDRIKKSVEMLDNKEVTLEFERLTKALVEANQLADVTLSDLLDSEISTRKFMSGDNIDPRNDRRNMMERTFRGPNNDFRPRRSQTYEREMRNSIKYE